MRVAIVHDFLTQRGGAERVVLALHRMFPGAPIYTSLCDPDGTFSEFASADVRTSTLQRLPHAGNAFRAYLPLYPAVFGRLRLEGYDLVISSSTHFAHGVDAGAAYHLCYCHAPPRWLYQTDTYLGEGGPLPSWTRGLLTPVLAAMRRWDRAAAQRPDAYVANSHGVADTIARLYGRRARVIHPPVDVERFASVRTTGRGDHYLVVARLLPYKRVDLAVRACTERGLPLIVVGEGPARRDLERLAGPTVSFAGRVAEEELTRLYASARALLHCGVEDFGIAALEANAAGRPVAAYAAGGALETVVDGATGTLFHEQTVQALHEALDRLGGSRWDSGALRAHAARFGEDRFAAEIHAAVVAALGVSAA